MPRTETGLALRWMKYYSVVENKLFILRLNSDLKNAFNEFHPELDQEMTECKWYRTCKRNGWQRVPNRPIGTKGPDLLYTSHKSRVSFQPRLWWHRYKKSVMKKTDGRDRLEHRRRSAVSLHWARSLSTRWTTMNRRGKKNRIETKTVWWFTLLWIYYQWIVVGGHIGWSVEMCPHQRSYQRDGRRMGRFLWTFRFGR